MCYGFFLHVGHAKAVQQISLEFNPPSFSLLIFGVQLRVLCVYIELQGSRYAGTRGLRAVGDERKGRGSLGRAAAPKEKDKKDFIVAFRGLGKEEKHEQVMICLANIYFFRKFNLQKHQDTVFLPRLFRVGVGLVHSSVNIETCFVVAFYDVLFPLLPFLWIYNRPDAKSYPNPPFPFDFSFSYHNAQICCNPCHLRHSPIFRSMSVSDRLTVASVALTFP